MPSIHQKSKMPPGKMQFGIIIPTEIHKSAKHIAADMGWRISDVYAEGVKLLMDSKRAGRGPEEMALLKLITSNKNKKDWALHEALAKFLAEGPQQSEMEMLKLILGKYLSKEAAPVAQKKVNA